jgi:hypothetical protein
MTDRPSPYLFARGPWPQPAPGFPDDAAPAVMHLPKEEQQDWNKHVASRYLKQLLFETPQAFFWSLSHAGVKIVTDKRMSEILTDGIFSKFVTPKLDPEDIALFEPRIPTVRDPGWYKTDYSVVRWIQPVPNCAVAPTTVLWREGAQYEYTPAAIAVNSVVFLPSDGKGWDLAKCFALQAAGISSTLYMHPLLHFPTDAVNAVVKTLFPTDHLIQKLFLPHFRLALGVDDAVLHGGSTVLKAGEVYAPYPGSLLEHLEIVSTLWRGLSHPNGAPNSAYPKYRFEIGPRVVYSRYGEFLRRYYDTLYAFGLEVALRIPGDDPLRVEFAEHLSFWIPGFPDPSEYAKPEIFAGVFATIVSDVAVGHTADHHLYGQVDIQEVPFRLRTEVPTSTRVAPYDPAKLTTWRDALNYQMCMKMFFAPYPVSFMPEVDYGFTDPDLRDANVRFRSALSETERGILAAGIANYVPLASMAPSVQF